MSLETVNTFGTLLTVAIVAATAVAAMIQLRHLRAGNQINAMLTIGDKFQGQEFTQALDAAGRGLAPALEDQAFRDYLIATWRGSRVEAIDPRLIDVRRATVLIGNTYEELGILLKTGIVDKDLFLDRYCTVAIAAWKRLEYFTAFTRDLTGDQGLWENFELVAVWSEDWLQAYPTTYPKSTRRLRIRNPWPVPPLPATA